MTRAALLNELRDCHVTHVWARYDGYNDEGWCKTPGFDPPNVDPALAQQVQQFFYNVLEEHYAGWECNDGACGVFEWDIQRDTLDLQHDVRSAERIEQRL